jgi:hypothetical protein
MKKLGDVLPDRRRHYGKKRKKKRKVKKRAKTNVYSK